MESILYKSLLYDFYNEMLTEKQREVYELYNHNDMSLSEIADYLSVTPQGVSDILKRTEKSLHNYEEKIGYLKNYKRQLKQINEINELIDQLDNTDNNDLCLELRKKVSDLLE